MAFDANDLSPHEHFVVERTNAGEIADFSAMGGPGGTKPIVRAGFLRKLLLRLDPSWAIRTPGVRIKGARIEGVLDLTDCSGEGLPALALVECEIPELVDVSHSRLARLSLNGSKLSKLVGSEAQIDGEVDISHVAACVNSNNVDVLTVRLNGIRIDGDLIADGAKLSRDMALGAQDALFLQGAEINGSLLMREAFECFGRVWLVAASIAGRIQSDGGQFFNRTDDGRGCAIAADDTLVGSGVLLRNVKIEGETRFVSAVIRSEFQLKQASLRNEGGVALSLVNAEVGRRFLCDAKISGLVRISGASFARNVDLQGSEISNSRGRGAHGQSPQYETAIDGANVRVGGAMRFVGANIKGEIFLADARIEGYLAFGSGRFIQPGGWAIRAPNARVGGNVTFKLPEDGFAPHGQKTVIEGGIKFDRARIEGALSWAALEVRGPGPDGGRGAVLSFADAQIAGAVQARTLTSQPETLIILAGASCGSLDDDSKSGWGAESAKLNLDGFTYQRLDNPDDRWRERLTWLMRSARFSPQPFTQAALVYARAGKREDARRIQLAQHDRRTYVASAGPFTWALSSLFGVTAGYGLAPIRVVRALALFLALGVFGVLAMNAQGALVTPQGRACNGAVEPTLYALDVALPVIDLGQESRCAPGRTARAELWQGSAVSDTSDWRWFEGVALWRWAHALYAMLGAILTALAIVTFSGIMKPKDE